MIKMNDYDDDDYVTPDENREKIAGDDMGILYEIQNDYTPDVYEGPFLVLEKEYDDFATCFKESKDRIYRKMVDLYGDMKDPSHDNFTLCVLATIEEQPFSTNFEINKETSGLILTVFIPHFESIEDYETCGRALKLYKWIQEN
jgi:hypothetical protein